MNESEARALNRAAEFLPQTTDDEKPAIRIGDALVFVYVTVADNGRPILAVTVDTEDVSDDSGVAASSEVLVGFGIAEGDVRTRLVADASGA